MCVLRNDYMIDVPSNQAKLVEYNTIASSFGILSQKVGEMQKYIKDKYPHLAKQHYEKLDAADPTFSEEEQGAIRFCNEAMKSFDSSMINYFAKAISLYKESMCTKFGR